MDKTIIYSQEQPRSYDTLKGWNRTVLGAGFATQDLLGSAATLIEGFAPTPDTPADLSINLAPGRVYSQAALDATTYGSIAADSTVVSQQGIAIAAQRATLTTAALTTGQSQWVLIEAAFAQLDAIPADDPTSGVLPFFNVDNPDQPFNGPNNNNQPLNTVRRGAVTIQVKYGTPAATGSEVPPAADAGFVPMYLIDLAYGQTAITLGEIKVAGPSVGTNVPSNYTQAPFLAGLLNQHHTGIAGQAPQIDLTAEVKNILPLANLPASSARAGGGIATVYVYAGNPNGNVAGSAGVPGTSAPDFCWDSSDGFLYVCTSTGTVSTAVWQQVTGRSGQIQWAGTSGGTANAQTLTPSPVLGAYAAGVAFSFTAGNTNTGATTINVSGLGVKNLLKQSGGGLIPCVGGELTATEISTIQYDGTEFQIIATNLSILATLGIGNGLRNDGNGNLQSNDPVTFVSTNQAATTATHRTKFVATANVSISIPHSTGLWDGWRIDAVGQGGSVTLTVNAGDAINGGAAGASYTIAEGMSGAITTDGAGNIVVTVSGGPASIAIVEIVNVIGNWTANKTCTHTCDLANCATTLGGACYQGTGLTFNFNGATVGINGMDTGVMPVSNDLHLYAAYNPTTNTWGVFGTAYGGGSRIYGGVNAPAGFTATCLLASLKCDGSGHLPANFYQIDRRIHTTPGKCLDNTAATAANTLQSLSIAAFVPANCKCISGNFGSSTTNAWQPVFCLSADSNGVAMRRLVMAGPSGANNTIDGFAAAARYDRHPLKTAQLLYWKSSDTLTRATVEITDYEF